MPLATIIDVGALFDVFVASLVAVTGVTIAYSLSILGAARFVEMRQNDRPLEAAAFAGLALLGLAISLAAVGLGIAAMLSK